MSRLEDWFRKAKEDEFGAFAERLWSGVFTGSDFQYISLFESSRRGAPMSGGKEKMILPDFQVNGGAHFQVYVDSKAKRHPVFYGHASENRHGIDRRNYQHYSDFGSRLGKHAALAIFEAFTDKRDLVWSGDLLVQTLQVLGEPCRGFSTGSHMVYWPRTKFKSIGTVTPEEASRLTSHYGEGERFKEVLWRLFERGACAPVQGVLF